MLRDLLRYWALSLMLSAVLVAAGERWRQPLPVQPWLVAALVLIPPLLMLGWLALHWSLPGEGGESQQSKADEL
ncbi:MAG: hypothetical protein FJ050_05600 [Cyanobacteria bacterium M_surface_7_m2_040]|nr:hypothetical protein [Cyanobacteria bacterium K_Offshore_0m_m2_072]MBM5808661.1 hypothetical protein [Cyanobacteria bacterium M_surface_9_m1_291]MBM5827517.1 hypothetical protein [Cyanobacteria bacterium M_surface_7_m2_040]